MQMLKLNEKYIFILGLIVITIVYSLYHIYFDLTYVPDISGKWKHVNKFVFVLIVYGIGTFVLRKFRVAWMMQLWHFLHIIFISALLLIGFYDWYHGSITDQIRNVANSIHEFLISPALYTAMGILQFRLFKQNESKIE
ncbi:MAG: hypothetical protein ABI405_13445 [Parafilimonas sp.]